MSAKYSVEYAEFSELLKKLEDLGVSMNEITDKVLDEVAPIAVDIYKDENHVPYDKTEYDSIHARNNVRASKTKNGKGGRYKLVGVFTENGNSIDWTIGQYLFYVENGTSKMPAYPFMKKTEAAIQAAVKPIMKSAMENEIKSRIGG